MVSRINSWCFWHWRVSKTWLEAGWSVDPYGICNVCLGAGVVVDGDDEYYCICNTQRWAENVAHSLRDLRSLTMPADINELNTEDIINGELLADAVQYAKEWAWLPRGYFILSGPYGVGKSHIMRWLNYVLHPLALYVTASDFNVAVHKHRKEDTLAVYVDKIARAPILLFDDWGMEYGGPLVESQFAHIVDSRDRDTDSFPMAVATNKDGIQIMLSDRVGSRLMNRDKSRFVSLDLEDYRVRLS